MQGFPQAAGPQDPHNQALQHVHADGVTHHHSELPVSYTLPATQDSEGDSLQSQSLGQ
jgi:hypothetical protein